MLDQRRLRQCIEWQHGIGGADGQQKASIGRIKRGKPAMRRNM
jgi:hypothetical protein